MKVLSSIGILVRSLALAVVFVGAAAPGFASDVTLEACKTDMRELVLSALAADAESPDEPGKLYAAQASVERECFARAVQAGVFTKESAEGVAARISQARDAVCVIPYANGAIPTTGEQNACELELLRVVLNRAP